jgi:hypothetical protein
MVFIICCVAVALCTYTLKWSIDTNYEYYVNITGNPIGWSKRQYSLYPEEAIAYCTSLNARKAIERTK